MSVQEREKMQKAIESLPQLPMESGEQSITLMLTTHKEKKHILDLLTTEHDFLVGLKEHPTIIYKPPSSSPRVRAHESKSKRLYPEENEISESTRALIQNKIKSSEEKMVPVVRVKR